MKRSSLFFTSFAFLPLCALWLGVSPLTHAQTAPAAPPGKDAAVQAIVNQTQKAELERTVRTLAAFPTRHTLSGANGADQAAQWIKAEFDKISRENGGRLQVSLDTWTQEASGERVLAPAVISNVVATLPGTDTPERVIVINGHYDSRVTDVMDAKSPAPGANDDASGVAVVLEAARRMAGHRFGATVIFAAVTGEEQGLYGSAHLAQTLASDKRNVVAMITNDIVGNSRGENNVRDDKTLRAFSAGYDPDPLVTPAVLARRRAYGTEAETPARLLARAVRDSARRYVKGMNVALTLRNDRYGRGGDHSSFLASGFGAAIRLTEPNEDWRHQHQNVRTENNTVFGDLPEFVDFDYLARVARINIAAIAEIALAPPPPASVTLKPDLSASTTLQWTPPSGALACEVLYRRTTAPDWETVRQFPAATHSCVLPVSKDDYLFAVRSVGARGARGVPVVPVAGR